MWQMQNLFYFIYLSESINIMTSTRTSLISCWPTFCGIVDSGDGHVMFSKQQKTIIIWIPLY